MFKSLFNADANGRPNSHVHLIRDEIGGVLIFVAIIWAVSLIGFSWEGLKVGLALIPRRIAGLDGIVTMPLVHDGFAHLIGNTIPLAILLILLAGSRGRTGSVVATIVIINGVLLWLLGGSAAHIGASGLVLGLITYLISSGLFEQRPIPLLISLGVGLFYGSTLVGNLLPGTPGVSWTGHLFGAIAGVIAGYAFASPATGKGPIAG